MVYVCQVDTLTKLVNFFYPDNSMQRAQSLEEVGARGGPPNTPETGKYKWTHPLTLWMRSALLLSDYGLKEPCQPGLVPCVFVKIPQALPQSRCGAVGVQPRIFVLKKKQPKKHTLRRYNKSEWISCFSLSPRKNCLHFFSLITSTCICQQLGSQSTANIRVSQRWRRDRRGSVTSILHQVLRPSGETGR